MDTADRFPALMGQDPAQIPLDEAALLVAADEYPQLDIAASLAQLDALANPLQPAIIHELEPTRLIQLVNAHLFETLGFRGNASDYYDPRNSYLNEVLDRRLGIPITLSIVFIAVARRLGLPVAGVSYPGHFLVVYQASDTPLYVDAFNRGTLVTERDLRRAFLEQWGPYKNYDPAHLQPASTHEVIARLLRNLKHIYLARDELPRAIRCCERIMLVSDIPADRRDLGIVLARAGRLREAVGVLEQYVAGTPSAPDRGQIHELVDRLQQRLRGLN